MSQTPVTQTPQKQRNIPAVVALVSGIAAVPASVFTYDIAAWIFALIGLLAGIAGARRAAHGAPGAALAVTGLVLACLVLLVLMGMLALLVTRGLRG
jgi:hypothetical protein